MLTQDRDEELVLFLEMRGREKGHRPTLPMGSDKISSTTVMSSQQYPLRRTAAENFLYSENEKSDYEWLVTPPGSPSSSVTNQLDAPEANLTKYETLYLLSDASCKKEKKHGKEHLHHSLPSSTIPIKKCPKMLTQDRDEELVLFLEMRGREKGHRPTLPMGSDKISSTTVMSSQQYPLRRTAAENFLYSENEKSDYEWLVTPPGSPSSSVTNQLDAPEANRMTLISQLENYSKEETDNISSKNQTTSLHNSSSVSGIRRPSSSSSSRSTSRPPTPTKRSTTPARRASTPTSRATSTAARATLTSSSTSSSRSTSRPSSSSGTSRVSLTTARATRPTTSTGQHTTGSATYTRSNNRPMSAPNSKPGSRSSTPTRRPSTPTGSSTVLRNKLTKPLSEPALSQGASPIVRSRPWEPYEMPGFSLEAPSNLRTTLPNRPQTASSSRTRAFGASSSSRSASIERDVARRQSCSPSRNRGPTGNVTGAVPSLRGRRANTKNDDGGLISHVAKGNQKVERNVNKRKLAPPRLTESGGRGLGGGGDRGSAGKSSSGSDGFGFGRNLSKSSIDMALRHMDIKRGSMAGNFRPSVTKVPATSLYSVKSYRNRPVSSSGSSESSVNILCLDGSDDNLSDISYS